MIKLIIRQEADECISAEECGVLFEKFNYQLCQMSKDDSSKMAAYIKQERTGSVCLMSKLLNISAVEACFFLVVLLTMYKLFRIITEASFQ